MKNRRSRKSVQPNAKASSHHGQPVCAVLKDGRYFIGRIEGVKDGELILSGVQGAGRWHPRSGRTNRAQVSGFLDSLLGGGIGGGAGEAAGGGGAEGAGAGGAGLGGLGGMLSTIRIGMNMLQAVMPLLSLFKL